VARPRGPGLAGAWGFSSSRVKKEQHVCAASKDRKSKGEAYYKKYLANRWVRIAASCWLSDFGSVLFMDALSAPLHSLWFRSWYAGKQLPLTSEANALVPVEPLVEYLEQVSQHLAGSLQGALLRTDINIGVLCQTDEKAVTCSRVHHNDVDLSHLLHRSCGHTRLATHPPMTHC
jgi:hypothetical protein